MTKNELIEALQAIEGNPKIMMSKDPEGNEFQDASDIELSITDSYGEPCHSDDEDADRDMPRVIVIWP